MSNTASATFLSNKYLSSELTTPPDVALYLTLTFVECAKHNRVKLPSNAVFSWCSAGQVCRHFPQSMHLASLIVGRKKPSSIYVIDIASIGQAVLHIPQDIHWRF